MTVWRRLQPGVWLYRWLLLLAWMALIFFLSAQPDLPNPQTGFLGELLSSGAHMFVFGVLAVLWAWVLAGRPRSGLLAFGLTMTYALSDEFHQAFVPGRHSDVRDLLCDALGAGLALLAWAWLRRWRAARQLRG